MQLRFLATSTNFFEIGLFPKKYNSKITVIYIFSANQFYMAFLNHRGLMATNVRHKYTYHIVYVSLQPL